MTDMFTQTQYIFDNNIKEILNSSLVLCSKIEYMALYITNIYNETYKIFFNEDKFHIQFQILKIKNVSTCMNISDVIYELELKSEITKIVIEDINEKKMILFKKY